MSTGSPSACSGPKHTATRPSSHASLTRRSGWDHTTTEASEPAEAQWVALMNAIARATIFLSCNSWYLGANIPGKPRLFMPMAGGFPLYAERCTAVAREGYAGFVIH